ncbi:GNAT family acetyltransferase [[Actinobacillus] muris]|uniref:GNAT family acetyltransferase n=1 Tax=Muribacter muris TaxID=67855 RepID=A0A0J5S4X9_9PAST|nr:GNAT family N-acetyltransferase [Muribacter muris]KMK51862.1 GNAT family acetyltransferase [[Actinobacillus] muris] [Muribacter muris]
MQIRPLNQHDLPALQAISRQTFHDTFADSNSAEDMQSYLAQHFSAEQLGKELSNLNTYFYFAEQQGEPIGYLKLNLGEAQTERQTDNAVEIERIYVLKEWQGKGIGQTLYEFAVQQAKARTVDFIWLGVWEHNRNALAFYQKNGFVPFGSHFFQLGNDLQTDILMKRQLNDERQNALAK